MGEGLFWAFLFAIVVVMVAMVVRYFFWQLETEIREAARLESDADYRAAVLADLDVRLAQKPHDLQLRRQRADVRRLHGDHCGVIADLQYYLAGHADDDAGWAEMAESQLAVKRPHEALTAAVRACALAPTCLEYHRLAAHAALLAKDIGAAQEAIALWSQAERARLNEERTRETPRMIGQQIVPAFNGDPALPWYRAALALASGRAGDAQAAINAILSRGVEPLGEEIAEDEALAPVAALLLRHCPPSLAGDAG